jgi:hypothetical protein
MRRPKGPHWIWPVSASFLIYLAISVFAYHHTGLNSIAGCACGDQAQEVSFFAWPAYALQHGINPFYSTWVNYPVGVNFTVNTAFTLLGILAIPITLTAGPVASFNVFLVLSFALSALAMCLVLRRWVSWWPATFAGGLLYGFSPYMIGQGAGHVFLTFVPIPPLIFLVLEEVIVRQARSPRKYGLLLGLLAAAQYYVSAEVLAITAVVAVVGVIVLAIANWRAVGAKWRHAAEAVLFAVPVCAAVVAYPVWFSLYGPAHTTNPPQSILALSRYPGDLLGGIVPTSHEVIGPMSLKAIGNTFTSKDVGENGLYLGIPLIVVLGVITAACRRVRGVVFFAFMLVASYLLALGPRLHVDTHDTGVPMPFNLVVRLPLMSQILAVRFSLFVQFFAAILFAIGLDRLRTWVRESGFSERLRSRRREPAGKQKAKRWAVACATGPVAVFSLVALTPHIPFGAQPTAIPSLFTAAIDQIPAGSVVLSYPYPFDPGDQILLPQAESNMRFKILGGPGHVPHPPGYPRYGPSILFPRIPEIIFNAAYFNPRQLPAQPKVVTATTLADLRTFLNRYDVESIVVYPVGQDPAIVEQYVTALLGPPQWTKDVVAWFHVKNLLAHTTGGK